MTDAEEVWGALSRDPRVPDQAELRASDADREVVLQVLTEAYAEGRIDREELDTRSSTTQSARTLGELVAPLEGLVSAHRRTGPVPMPPTVLEQRAVEAWRKDRREALWGLVSVSAIVWTIWLVTSGVGSFPWPLFVSLAALLNLGRIQVQRDDIVRDARRRLEKKQRKELGQREQEDDR